MAAAFGDLPHVYSVTTTKHHHYVPTVCSSTEIKTTRGSPFRRGTEIKTTRGSPFRRGTESRSAPSLQLFGCGCPVCLRLSEDWL